MKPEASASFSLIQSHMMSRFSILLEGMKL